jgi:hypothetical protein
MSFWNELRTRVLPPVVQEEEQHSNDTESQEVPANVPLVPMVPVQVSQEGFNEKEGANEKGGMAV